MEIQTRKTDISFPLEHNISVSVELLRINDLWKIEVPHIIENKELIDQLSSADNLVDKYVDILYNAFKKYNYINIRRNVKHRFLCSSSTQINKTAILPSTVEISDVFSKYGIKRKSWDGDDHCYHGFGTVVNGELLSWCIENSHYLDEDSTIVGVRTDENYRKNGYAASNVAALCDCLQGKGVSTIYYECALDNIASYRTAQKANLEYIGEVYYLSFQDKTHK